MSTWQVHKATGLADDNTLLPGFQTKAVTEFHQEIMEIIQERGFEVGLADNFTGFEAKEFKDIGIADGQFRFGLFSDGVGHGGQLFLVKGKAGPLVIQGGNLPLECPNRPIAPYALDFVKCAFQRVCNGEQFNQVSEGEPLHQDPRIRSPFGNHRFPRVGSGVGRFDHSR
jgi:hypothetical protein